MIIKNGIDILYISRIEKIFYSNLKNKFLSKILTNNELLFYENTKTDKEKINFLTKRFSAKEAVSKAIGCGIQNKYLTFKDLEIAKDKFGAPFIKKNEILDNIIKEIYNTFIYNVSISISDEKDLVISSCFISLTF